MPYRVYRGQFRIHNPAQPSQGPQPDGDTVRFVPDNPLLLSHLQGGTPDFKADGGVNIRFEAIDALELHFSGSHQPIPLAEASRDSMISQLGFGNVSFFANNPVVVETVQNHPVDGHVIAKDVDPFGRVIGWVYAGLPADVDGSQIWLDGTRVASSVNAELIRQGHAYPAFYTTLPSDLRAVVAGLVQTARGAGVGLWSSAVGLPGGQFVNPANVTDLESLVLWPKLFRRLVPYFAEGFTDVSSLDCWLREDPVHRDDGINLPNGEQVHIHNLLEITANGLRLNHHTDEFVIIPDSQAPAVTPCGESLADRPIRIIAALANPVAVDQGNETVTILNRTPAAINLQGWSLADRQDGREPLAGSIAPGQALQVTIVAGSAVRLGNAGDTITLFDDQDRLVDQVSYIAEQVSRQGWTVVF